eukprot:TRINITY_DN62078_c0_g1_i1.p1 TRINITY_DN62078_c0_g1~~TRINITY_DN62078_c0_g1_i1.p1  ORF type:complete len:113 (+),score=27.64 TRINITY_DN62078_c0_g1_i1:64-402(+)
MAPNETKAADDQSTIASGTADGENEKQQNIMDILDELISVNRSILAKILGVCVCVLLCISGSLVYSEVQAGRTHLALTYGGFFILVLGLVASVAFVLFEVSRIEDSGGKKAD